MPSRDRGIIWEAKFYDKSQSMGGERKDHHFDIFVFIDCHNAAKVKEQVQM